MKPSPCSFTAGQQRKALARSAASFVTSAPTVRSLLIIPRVSRNSTFGSSVSRPSSLITSKLRYHGPAASAPARNPAPRLSGFVLPAPKQSEQSRLVRLQLLRWLARYSGYDASDKPARLTHLDYRDERAILIKGRMASAQVVCLGHGTLRRLLPSDDGALSSPRPIVSSTSNAISPQQERTEPSTSNAISPQQERTEPSGPQPCRRGAKSSPPHDFSCETRRTRIKHSTT